MSVKYRVTKRGYVVFSLTGAIVLALFIIGMIQLYATPQVGVSKNADIQQTTEQPVASESSTEQTPTTNQPSTSLTETDQAGSKKVPEAVQPESTQKPPVAGSAEMRTTEIKKTSARVYFEPDKFILDSAYYTQLDALISVALKYEDVKIVIEGNYNGYPGKKTSKFWLKLSNDRAEVVMAYIVAKGLLTERISIVNNGCNNMINQNDSMEEIKKNRRVDVYLK